MISMITTMDLNFASVPAQIRNTLDRYMPWIRSCTADDGSGLVQLRFEHPVAMLAAYQLIGSRCRTPMSSEARTSLEKRLDRIEFPPGTIPSVALRQTSLSPTSREWLTEWLDCPVALYFSGFSGAVVAADIVYVCGAGQRSDWHEVLLAKREDVPAMLALMQETLDGKHVMRVMGGDSVMIQPFAWDDLVLDASVVRLVREDFRLFLEREEWYKRHRLPFRRGYLFYGPPGNGKSSAIRAMLSAPGVSGFMLNPFRTFDEDILGAMFKEASESTPAIIVLEDLDRCYPLDKELEPESRIPLQQLLNHLDGVGSQDGVVVAATANDPSILDSAILRRPGRFDRVVGFKNPPAELRQRYFRHMCAALESEDLTECVRMTENFSFAQLREAYILAGQIALEEDGEINASRLVRAICTLTETMMAADRKWNSPVGFQETV